jgi:hypothetical protein
MREATADRVLRSPARLARLLDLGSEVGDEPDLVIRKRTAVASALAFMAIAAVLGIADIVLGQRVQAALALTQILVFGAALIAFGRTHRLTPLVVTMCVIGMAVLFLSLIPGGGLSCCSWGPEPPCPHSPP